MKGSYYDSRKFPYLIIPSSHQDQVLADSSIFHFINFRVRDRHAFNEDFCLLMLKLDGVLTHNFLLWQKKSLILTIWSVNSPSYCVKLSLIKVDEIMPVFYKAGAVKIITGFQSE